MMLRILGQLPVARSTGSPAHLCLGAVQRRGRVIYLKSFEFETNLMEQAVLLGA